MSDDKRDEQDPNDDDFLSFLDEESAEETDPESVDQDAETPEQEKGDFGASSTREAMSEEYPVRIDESDETSTEDGFEGSIFAEDEDDDLASVGDILESDDAEAEVTDEAEAMSAEETDEPSLEGEFDSAVLHEEELVSAEQAAETVVAKETANEVVEGGDESAAAVSQNDSEVEETADESAVVEMVLEETEAAEPEPKAKPRSRVASLLVPVVVLLLGLGAGAAAVYIPLNSKLGDVQSSLDSKEQKLKKTVTDLQTARDGKEQAEAELHTVSLAKEEFEKRVAPAEKERDDARIAKAAADKQKKAAEKQRDASQTALKAAEMDKEDAEKQRDVALAAQNDAEKEKQEAEKQRDAAQVAQTDSQKKLQEAQKRRDAALLAKQEAVKQQADAENRAKVLGTRLAQSGGTAGSSKTVIALLKNEADALQGASKAQKHLDVASLSRSEALRLMADPAKNQQVKQLLGDAVQSAEESRKLAEQTKDNKLLLDALFAKGRALEIGGDFDKAIESYQQGATEASTELDRSRFHSAILRVRISGLRKTQPAANKKSARLQGLDGLLRPVSVDLASADNQQSVYRFPETSRTVPVRLLRAQQATQPPMADLQQILQSAQKNVELGKKTSKSAVFYYGLGQAHIELAKRYLQTKQATEALANYDHAIKTLEDGFQAYHRFPPETTEDNLDNLLLARLFDEYGTANRARTSISEADRIDGYKQLAIVYQDAEQRWAQTATQAAKTLEFTEPLSGKGSRWSNQTQKSQTEEWMSELERRAAAVVQARNLFHQERDRYVAAEKSWKKTATHIAALTGFKQSPPGDDERWTTASKQTEAWKDNLTTSVRLLGIEFARFRNAENQWASAGARIAESIGYKAPLPNDPARWTTETDITKAWIGDLADLVADLVIDPAGEDEVGKSETAREQSLAFFSDGLDQVNKGEYNAAIDSFSNAIKLYRWDARYFYYRGIARHRSNLPGDAQKAIRDVQRGAALERHNMPDVDQIYRALERVQYKTRNWVESFRPKTN